MAFYKCDPEKNTKCKKTFCQTYCFLTTKPEFKADLTLIEFYKRIEGQPVEDLIVKLKYKYSHEKEWNYSYEILTRSSPTSSEWLNDWDEGQEEVFVLGWLPVDKVNIPGD